MEEKDVTFNIITDEKNNINIVSDIEDCIDYLNINEKTALAVKCLSLIFSSIINDDNLDDGNTADAVYDITSDLIQAVVNIGCNSINIFTGNKPEMFECSTCVYEPQEKLGNVNIYAPAFSLHSGDLSLIDPLQASYAFLVDVIETISDYKSKEDVKKLIQYSLDAIKRDCNELINELYEE